MSFLLDVALGVLLMSWLYRDDHIAMLANMLVPAADVSRRYSLGVLESRWRELSYRKSSPATVTACFSVVEGFVKQSFCSLACSQGAGGAAAVADGSSCWPEDEPGAGPGAGTLLPLSHPPLDQ